MRGAAPEQAGGAQSGVAAGAAGSLPRRRRLGTALALAGAVLLFGVMDGFPLVVLPLGVLLLGLGRRQRWWWLAFGVVAWMLALAPAGGPLATLSRGWGLALGGGFLALTVAFPRWHASSRALAALAAVLLAGAAGLAVTGAWPRFDAAMADHFRSLAALSSTEFFGRLPESRWTADLSGMGHRMAELQALLFPALLALQSLAALALAWWVFGVSRPGGDRSSSLRPLREFRFHDSLVWLVVAGLALILLPIGDGAVRVGYNALFFMGALYVLRGVAVFVFLARGAPTVTSVILGTLATVLFYPIVFTAALLVGLGDTWLDVRGRVVAAASQA